MAKRNQGFSPLQEDRGGAQTERREIPTFAGEKPGFYRFANLQVKDK